MQKKLSTPSSLNINRPATGSTVGQNVATSLTRVKRAPDAGGTGTIHKS